MLPELSSAVSTPMFILRLAKVTVRTLRGPEIMPIGDAHPIESEYLEVDRRVESRVDGDRTGAIVAT
jgi:hypothetical protein